MNDEGSLIRRIAMIIKGIAGYAIILALLIMVTYSVVNYSFRFGFTIFCAESVDEAPGTDVDVVVEKGETIDELAAKLYENGVIPSELAFRVQARLYDIGFYPGTYKVNTSMSTKEILKTIDMTEQEYADSLALQAAQEETADGIYGGGDEGTDLEAAGGEAE